MKKRKERLRQTIKLRMEARRERGSGWLRASRRENKGRYFRILNSLASRRTTSQLSPSIVYVLRVCK